MKRFPLLVVASAVAAALAAPVVLAQITGGDTARGSDHSVTDGRSGGTGIPSSTSGAVPSTQPGQDRQDIQRNPGDSGATLPDGVRDRSSSGTGATSRGGARPSERSATDGRTGGTGPTSGSAASTRTSMTDDRMGGRGMGWMDGQGHSASTVRNVQQSLYDKGFDVGPIDGRMGPRTRSALREFQQRQGLEGSGQLNQETMSALDVQTTSRTNGSRTGG